ncbi:hypothetical protein SAMN05216266_1062 [Amycolatopsis marina]|uniref:Tat (Twin-arginine translocation) pathway signal sequence n=1 Tax=Amycolatopsis marina TaxID=490629 RepID=A0A1I0YZP4_9PSEU|nr:hypothetical protein [Amycolatopsis marina]SFB18909.1 hypothetical protein SAMN05216266_1062 [Amycolatopsis marina]
MATNSDSGGTAASRLMCRRDLLIRAGVLGAAAAAGGAWPATASAEVPEALEPLLELVAQPALDLLTRDTYGGLAVFGVPGPDRYSAAQSLLSTTPGGIEADSPALIQHTLDFFVPWPDTYVHALTAAFTTGVSEVPIPTSLLGGLLKPLEAVGATLDDVLLLALRNDRTLPISLALALLMNVAATQVRPTSVLGPIADSPFANLTHREKAAAFQRIEHAHPALVALLDGHLPEPLNETASGLLRYAGGLLLTLCTFTAYTEFAVFDRDSRRAVSRPVGWDLSNYMPGRITPADGWAEFVGYYQGRRAVTTAPELGER